MALASKVSDIFKQGECGVCGCTEVNRYFSIQDNYIDYNGSFVSYQEIIAESLDFQLSEDYEATELCWDCKENILKFFHFKRKIREVQNRRRLDGLCLNVTTQFEQTTEPARTQNTTSTRLDNIFIKPEPLSENEGHPESSNSFSDIFIKEEPEEQPVILRAQITSQTRKISVTAQQLQNKPKTRRKRGLDESLISYGAQKMRDYRERLKKPENRMKLLKQKQLQREWNRRAYIKRQIENGLPILARRSHSSYSDELTTDHNQYEQNYYH